MTAALASSLIEASWDVIYQAFVRRNEALKIMSIWWDLKEHLGEQRSVKAGLKGAYVRLRDAGQGPDKYVIRKVGAMMLLEPQQGSAGQGRDQEHPSVSRVRLQISEGMARLLQLSQSWPQQEELEAFQAKGSSGSLSPTSPSAKSVQACCARLATLSHIATHLAKRTESGSWSFDPRLTPDVLEAIYIHMRDKVRGEYCRVLQALSSSLQTNHLPDSPSGASLGVWTRPKAAPAADVQRSVSMPPPSLQAPLAIQPLQRKQTVAGIYEGPPPHPGLNPSLGPRAREGSGPEADGVQPGDLPPSKRPKGT